MIDESLGSDPYAIVRADLVRRIEELEAAVRAIDQVRGSTASIHSEPKRETARATDEPGDFLGLSIAEAARKLLGLRRRSLNSAEIAEGLSSSGYPMTAADPANVVGSVLSRRFDNVGDVVRVSRGQWGLPEWYPNRSFRKKEKDANDKKSEADAISNGESAAEDMLKEFA